MQPVKGLNHVGIAVRSIAEQRALYEQTLGARFEGIEEVPAQKVRVAFFRVGGILLELLEPTAADSPIAAFLEKRGGGLHHLAFTVEDLPARIEELKRGGAVDDRRGSPAGRASPADRLRPSAQHARRADRAVRADGAARMSPPDAHAPARRVPACPIRPSRET
jgi:methylmalonyl-CoA/ethylmalonyl-CoA epimerase